MGANTFNNEGFETINITTSTETQDNLESNIFIENQEQISNLQNQITSVEMETRSLFANNVSYTRDSMDSIFLDGYSINQVNNMGGLQSINNFALGQSNSIETYNLYSDAEEAVAAALFPDAPGLSEKFKNALKNVQPTDSPLDIFKKMDQEQNFSTKEKIEIARALTAYNGSYTYDYDMINGNDSSDISTQDYWNKLRNGDVAGVCRHIHREGAKVLDSLGIKAGVVSTNSTGRHAITWAKISDDKYFLIDYGTIYEGKNLRDLQKRYLATKGSIDFSEAVSDADGNIIGTFQTDIEKMFTQINSVLGEGDTLDTMEDLENQKNKKSGFSYENTVADGLQKHIASYKTEGGTDFQVYYGTGKNEYQNFTSIGGGISKYLDTKYGTFYGKVLANRTNLNSINGIEKTTIGGSALIGYDKVLYKDDKTQVKGTIAGSVDGFIGEEFLSGEETNYADIKEEVGGKLKIDHALSDVLRVSGELGIGADFDTKNIGGGSIVPYEKYSAKGSVTYKPNESTWIKGSAEYKNSLKGQEISAGIEGRYKDFTASFEASHLNPGDNPFVAKTNTYSGKFGYDLSENTNISFYGNAVQERGRETDYQAGVQFKMNF
ncbi:hypothetical protein KGV55_02750 [Candidatus Gracilibacteria bacterium]|nr:hypothetical protein [Candidatus Gracilibacteria bacterium]